MSPLTHFAQTLEKLPVYTASYVFSLLVAIMSDPILTSLVLGSVALGLVTNVWIALAAFFFTYVVVRTINSIANAIGMTGQHVVNEMRFQARFMTEGAVPPITPLPPETETPST